MSTYVRGGAWTNVEDEILRAAISKYGLNQWARVSSLLARKTASQAKARWYEWLNPTIKKNEWSQEEDEKLLHLAKLMPTQWRSIGEIVGRTANQCIQRYQELLDDADQRESGSGSTTTDVSMTGIADGSAAPATGPSGALAACAPAPSSLVGGLEHVPEIQPALPDAIDMDEDEKEMLAEARARLANTKGKKAKRKDRERILAESKRLALLQKRRELSEAGIKMKLHTKNKTGIDYNADVPFEHKPAAGFYDTTEEELLNAKAKDKYEKSVVAKPVINKDSEDKTSKRERKEKKDASGSAILDQLSSALPDKPDIKRRKLELPAAQVQDDELEQIIKFTRQGHSMKQKLGLEEKDEEMLESMSTRDVPEEEHTRGTPTAESYIQSSIRDLRAINESRSALSGKTTKESDEELNLPSTLVRSNGPVATPNLQLRTPVNHSRRETGNTDIRKQLLSKLQSLPKPKNEIEIVVPEEEHDTAEEEGDETAQGALQEDAGIREARLEKQKELARLEALERRSQVLKLGLPRPIVFGRAGVQDITFNLPTPESSNTNEDLSAARSLISAEARNLIFSDSIKYPIDGAEPFDKEQVADLIEEDLDKQSTRQALELIEQELGKVSSGMKKEEPIDIGVVDVTDFDSLSDEEIMMALSKIAEGSNKQEEKLQLVLGGYQKRRAALSSSLIDSFNQAVEYSISLDTYQQLADMESWAITTRTASLQQESNYVVDQERLAQEKFRDLH